MSGCSRVVPSQQSRELAVTLAALAPQLVRGETPVLAAGGCLRTPYGSAGGTVGDFARQYRVPLIIGATVVLLAGIAATTALVYTRRDHEDDGP